MMWLFWLLVAGIAMWIVGGLWDRQQRRAEARRELARARALHLVLPAVVYEEAHEHLHRAARPLLGHIPHQRTGGGRG